MIVAPGLVQPFFGVLEVPGQKPCVDAVRAKKVHGLDPAGLGGFFQQQGRSYKLFFQVARGNADTDFQERAQGFPASSPGRIKQGKGKLSCFGLVRADPALEPGLAVEDEADFDSEGGAQGDESQYLFAAGHALIGFVHEHVPVDVLEKLRKGSWGAALAESAQQDFSTLLIRRQKRARHLAHGQGIGGKLRALLVQGHKLPYGFAAF